MHKSTSSPSLLSAARDDPSQTLSSCPAERPIGILRQTCSSVEQPSTTQETNTRWGLGALNPLNYMPSLSNKREHAEQTVSLPLSREESSIPRGDADSNWEYPSPQQMYNAMLRKGYTDTPADAVESMVAVHNFLNEGAWDEIVAWEAIFSKGLRHGWVQCRKGEEGIAMDRVREELLRQRRRELGAELENKEDGPRLVRFMGRPGEMTPKARMMQALGWAFPERYGSVVTVRMRRD